MTGVNIHPRGEIVASDGSYPSIPEECWITFMCGEAEVSIHNQTADSLERLGYAILNAAQHQRDRDGRRALAEGKIDLGRETAKADAILDKWGQPGADYSGHEPVAAETADDNAWTQHPDAP